MSETWRWRVRQGKACLTLWNWDHTYYEEVEVMGVRDAVAQARRLNHLGSMKRTG